MTPPSSRATGCRRNANGSHNPAEAMDIADLMAGVDAMWRAIRATEA
jgi:acetylornithine deacetylase/succinyl-diaminopimelate desuccinylase-like protein